MQWASLREERVCDFPRGAAGPYNGRAVSSRQLVLPRGANERILSPARAFEAGLLIDAGSGCYAVRYEGTTVCQEGFEVDAIEDPFLEVYDVSPDVRNPGSYVPGTVVWRIALPDPLATVNNRSDQSIHYAIATTGDALYLYVLLTTCVVYKIRLTQSQSPGFELQLVNAMEIAQQDAYNGFQSFSVAGPSCVVFGTLEGLRVCKFAEDVLLSEMDQQLRSYTASGAQLALTDGGNEDAAMNTGSSDNEDHVLVPRLPNAPQHDFLWCEDNRKAQNRLTKFVGSIFSSSAPSQKPPDRSVLLTHTYDTDTEEVLVYSADNILRLVSTKSDGTRGDPEHVRVLAECTVDEALNGEDQFSLRVASHKHARKVVIGAKQLFLFEVREAHEMVNHRSGNTNLAKVLRARREIVTTHTDLLPSHIALTETSLYVCYTLLGDRTDEILHVDAFPVQDHVDLEDSDVVHPVRSWTHSDDADFREEAEAVAYAESPAFQQFFEQVTSFQSGNEPAQLAVGASATEFVQLWWARRILKRNRFTRSTVAEVLRDMKYESSRGFSTGSMSPPVDDFSYDGGLSLTAESLAASLRRLQENSRQGQLTFSEVAFEFIEKCRDYERSGNTTLSLTRVRAYRRECGQHHRLQTHFEPVARLTAAGVSLLRPVADEALQQVWTTCSTFTALGDKKFYACEDGTRMGDLSPGEMTGERVSPCLVRMLRAAFELAAFLRKPETQPALGLQLSTIACLRPQYLGSFLQGLRDTNLPEAAAAAVKKSLEEIGNVEEACGELLRLLHQSANNPAVPQPGNATRLLPLRQNPPMSFALGEWLQGSIATAELEVTTDLMTSVLLWMYYHQFPSIGGMHLEDDDNLMGGDQAAARVRQYLEQQAPFQQTVQHCLAEQSGATPPAQMGKPFTLLDEFLSLKHLQAGATDIIMYGNKNSNSPSRSRPSNRAQRPIFQRSPPGCGYESLNAGVLLARAAVSAVKTSVRSEGAQAQTRSLFDQIVNYTSTLPLPPDAPRVPSSYFQGRAVLEGAVAVGADDALELETAASGLFQTDAESGCVHNNGMWAAVQQENPSWEALLERTDKLLIETTSSTATSPAFAPVTPLLNYFLHVAQLFLDCNEILHALDFITKAAEQAEDCCEQAFHDAAAQLQNSADGDQEDEEAKQHRAAASASVLDALETLAGQWSLLPFDFTLEYGLWQDAFSVLIRRKNTSESPENAKLAEKLALSLMNKGALDYLIEWLPDMPDFYQDVIEKVLIRHEQHDILYTLYLSQGRYLQAAYEALTYIQALEREATENLVNVAQEELDVEDVMSPTVLGFEGDENTRAGSLGLLEQGANSVPAQNLGLGRPLVYTEFMGTFATSDSRIAAKMMQHNSSTKNPQHDADLVAKARLLDRFLRGAVPADLLKQQQRSISRALIVLPESGYAHVDVSQRTDAKARVQHGSKEKRDEALLAEIVGSATISSPEQQPLSEEQQHEFEEIKLTEDVKILFDEAEKQAAETVVTAKDLHRWRLVLKARHFFATCPLPTVGYDQELDAQVIEEIQSTRELRQDTHSSFSSVLPLLHDPRYLSVKLAQQGLGVDAVKLCKKFDGVDIFKFAIKPFLTVVVRCERAEKSLVTTKRFFSQRSQNDQRVKQQGPDNLTELLVKQNRARGCLSGMFLHHDGLQSTKPATLQKHGVLNHMKYTTKALWRTAEQLIVSTGTALEASDYLVSIGVYPLPATIMQFFLKSEYQKDVNRAPGMFSEVERDQFFSADAKSPRKVLQLGENKMTLGGGGSSGSAAPFVDGQEEKTGDLTSMEVEGDEDEVDATARWTDLLRIFLYYQRYDGVLELLEKKVERRGIAGLDDAESVPVDLILQCKRSLQQLVVDQDTTHRLEDIQDYIERLDTILADFRTD
ncbi:unnamed protein product [Amoebophrya sp. A120]|nr:unnamed protein product [Amoebophrya sp. A120]|eukprot:GSA120T00011481001.1